MSRKLKPLRIPVIILSVALLSLLLCSCGFVNTANQAETEEAYAGDTGESGSTRASGPESGTVRDSDADALASGDGSAPAEAAEGTESSQETEGSVETAASAETEASEETSSAVNGDISPAADAASAEAWGAPAQPESGASSAAVFADGNGMSYARYQALPMGSYVTVDACVQDVLRYADGKADLFAQSEDGAFFIRQLRCTQEEYNALTPGRRVEVSGYKTDFSGEQEISDASLTPLDGSFVAQPLDIIRLLDAQASECGPLLDATALWQYQNRKLLFTGMTVEPMWDGSSAVFYGWDNSHAGDSECDLYFNLSCNGSVLTFVVHSALRSSDSDAYRTARNLRIGDTVDAEAYLYWYNGPQPWVTELSVR